MAISKSAKNAILSLTAFAAVYAAIIICRHRHELNSTPFTWHYESVTDSIWSAELDTWRLYTVTFPVPDEACRPKSDSPADSPRFERLPVLYLLHGMYGGEQDWIRVGHLTAICDSLSRLGQMSPMLIVTPDAGGDPRYEQNGYFNMEDWPYENFFFGEFMPAVESAWNPDSSHRALAGLSMGGGATAVYAQRHPQLFCAAYDMSGAVGGVNEKGEPAPREDLIMRKDDPQHKIRNYALSVDEHNCIRFLLEADEARLEPLRQIDWFVDCGDDDFLLDGNLAFYQTMRRKNIPCQLRVRDGGHTWSYWRSALEICLPFVSESFEK